MISEAKQQTIKLPNHDDVVFSNVIKHPSELGSIAIAPGNFLLKDSTALRLFQGPELQIEILVKS
jgi:hypothetical protein